MFSEPYLLQKFCLFHLRLGIRNVHHFGRRHFLCIESFSIDFRCVHLFKFLNVCDQDVSFPYSILAQRISKENIWQDFWIELMKSRQVSGRNKVIFCHRSKRSNQTIEWYSDTPFTRVSSHQTKDLECFADTSNIIESAHHFSSRPDCNSTADVPFFHSAHCSLSNPISFRYS